MILLLWLLSTDLE